LGRAAALATGTIPAHGNFALVEAAEKALYQSPDRSLSFTNPVDFDMLYGHRRDVTGYANALEKFDAQLPKLLRRLVPGDILVITGDHGCDPTWRGTDHTREYVSILATGPELPAKCIDPRKSFADIGQSIAAWFGLRPLRLILM
jgi:phosphopentomutase